MKPMTANVNKHASHGTTLVEILVTIVVVSIGLLGILGLQTVSLRNNHSSFLRGQATVLATDIIDRIRANRDNALSYDINFADASPTTGMHGTDITAWRNDIGAALPTPADGTPAGGEIDVTQIAPGRFQVIVRIRWGEREETSAAGADSTAMQFETRTEV